MMHRLYVNYCIRHHHDEIRRRRCKSNTEQNACSCFYRWEFTDFVFPLRYTQVFGDTMNIPLCGIIKMYLSAMFFGALSAIMVKYLFQLLTVTACYIPHGVSVLTSIFPQKQNRNINIKITYNYNRDATAFLRGKL